MLSKEQIDELERAVAAMRSPAPWWESEFDGSIRYGDPDVSPGQKVGDVGDADWSETDLIGVFALRNAAPALIALAREALAMRPVVEAAGAVYDYCDTESTRYLKGEAPTLMAVMDAVEAYRAARKEPA